MDLELTLLDNNILFFQQVMISLKDLLIQMNFLWFLNQTNVREQLPKNLCQYHIIKMLLILEVIML